MIVAPTTTEKMYRLTGMTCGSCANGVKSKLEALPEVETAEVSLAKSTVTLSLKRELPVAFLQEALGAGKYEISELTAAPVSRITAPSTQVNGGPTSSTRPAATSADPLRKTYAIDGMTCGSCQAKVQQQLTALPEVASASVDLAGGTVAVQLAYPTSASYLNRQLEAKYTLYDPSKDDLASARTQKASAGAVAAVSHTPTVALNPSGVDSVDGGDDRSWFETYRPLLTIVGLIALVTAIAAFSSQAAHVDGSAGMTWTRLFMAGFFIVFAGFKLLDVTGFSDSYRMYDVIAKRWRGWGLLYPFVELGLGLAYLANVAPVWTSVATISILGVSAIGVIQSVMNKRAIKCACLGTGFNLPMTTVTIVEDVGMVAMAAWMLLVMA